MARSNSISPPEEIKAGKDSGETCRTFEMSEMSLNDCDSVVSEITFDPAFRDTKKERSILLQDRDSPTAATEYGYNNSKQTRMTVASRDY